MEKFAGDIIINIPTVPGAPSIPGTPGTVQVVPGASGGAMPPPLTGQPEPPVGEIGQQDIVPMDGLSDQLNPEELGDLNPEEMDDLQMSARDLPVSDPSKRNYTHDATPAMKDVNQPNSGNIPITKTKTVNKVFSPDVASAAGSKDSIGGEDYTNIDTGGAKNVPMDDIDGINEEFNNDFNRSTTMAEDKGISIAEVNEKVKDFLDENHIKINNIKLKALIERGVSFGSSTDDVIESITQILNNRK